LATPAQLAQIALNIAVPLQNNVANGQYEDVYVCVSDLCAALIALAEAVINSGGGTQTVGTQYSALQSTTSPIFTKIR
jgi:hypothetical protein